VERFLAIAQMVEADLARLADCWALARRAGEELPWLERVLAQDLGDAAERTFVIERFAQARFRFGIASDRILLRLGFDASGREINDRPPWPEKLTPLLERASLSRATVELLVAAETTHGDAARLAVHLFPVAYASGERTGFIGFAHAFARSSDALEEFGLITHTKIAAAVLTDPESHQGVAAALA
jgi:hypothetical protein